MYRKGMARRIVSIALAAVLLTAILFEGKVNVVAAESKEQVSSTKREATATTETKSISAGDVSGGDISDGDMEKEDEKNFSGESIASGISRGCAWTIDAEGNLIVRDSDGEYGTKEWGWLEYTNDIKKVDVDILYVDQTCEMFLNCKNMTEAKIKIDKTQGKADGMFRNCTNLINIDVKEFNTQHINSMKNMFDYCKNLSKLEGLSSKVCKFFFTPLSAA